MDESSESTNISGDGRSGIAGGEYVGSRSDGGSLLTKRGAPMGEVSAAMRAPADALLTPTSGVAVRPRAREGEYLARSLPLPFEGAGVDIAID